MNVPGVQELFTPDAITRLGSDQELCRRIYALQAQEKNLLNLLGGIGASDIHRVCQARIAQMLSGEPAEEIAVTADDPAAFEQSIIVLPRLPSTAKQRRRIRETARVYLRLCEGSLFIPQDIKGFQQLWELAMEGEPRWNDHYPSSAFRTGEATILDSLLGQNVLQVCSEPADFDRELTLLLELLSQDALLPEIRAICGFALFEWIHPFVDGNGHTGRMLMLAVLSGIYSLPSVVCFSSALVMEKYRTTRAFAIIRTGEGCLNDFCACVLSQLEDAQPEAMRLIQGIISNEASKVPDRRK